VLTSICCVNIQRCDGKHFANQPKIETAASRTTHEGMSCVVLFDGACALCHGCVKFLMRFDQRGVFKFAPLQSMQSQQLLQQYQLHADLDSMVLVEQTGDEKIAVSIKWDFFLISTRSYV
jgi:hypothetical protein